jgi:hypothetical protein
MIRMLIFMLVCFFFIENFEAIVYRLRKSTNRIRRKGLKNTYRLYIWRYGDVERIILEDMDTTTNEYCCYKFIGVH